MCKSITKRGTLISIIVALVIPLQPSRAQDSTGVVEDTIFVNQFIVKTDDEEALLGFVDTYGLEVGPLITYPDPSEEVLEMFGCYYIVTIPDSLQTIQDSLINELEGLPGIDYVEPNLRIQLEPEINEESCQNPFNMPDSFHNPYTPNDPLFPQQWSKTHTETDWAWNVSTGEGASIAIIDSGVATDHEDLADNLDLEHSYNFYLNNKNVEDSIGHGTSLAGCAAAKIDNNKGIAGIAGNAKIIALKVDDEQGQMSFSAINNAIIYSADNELNVINMSFGTYEDYPTEHAAVDYAWGKGCFLCSTAGNDSINKPRYPGAYENVICVGASDASDGRCWFSNYGPSVDIYAPGIGVWRTIREGGYKTLSGTSIACPQVAGLAALIWSAHPEWTNQEVWDKIIESADTITIDKGEALRMNSRKALDVEIIEDVKEETVAECFEVISSIGQQIVLRYKNLPEGFHASVYDASGRKADELNAFESSGIATWGVPHRAGVYFICVHSERSSIIQKIILIQ